MSTYPTYQAAKIANPNQEIYELNGKFQTGDTPARSGDKWELCNPADYCMTVKQFLDAGHKFVEGDMYVTEGAITPATVGTGWGAEQCNEPYEDDDKYYVIKAKALEETKPETEPTYRYEKVTDYLFDLKEEFERGELFNSKNAKSPIDEIEHLAAMFVNGTLYRRIEVTERELFIAEFNKTTDEHFAFDVSHVAGKLFDAGCRFVNDKG